VVLALCKQVIILVRFPRLLYRKLLARRIALVDFTEIDRELAWGFDAVLTFSVTVEWQRTQLDCPLVAGKGATAEATKKRTWISPFRPLLSGPAMEA
jgi:hypothetical protein